MKKFAVEGPRPSLSAIGDIIAADGRNIGRAEVVEGKRGILMTVSIAAGSGLLPGFHDLHFHSLGNCTDGKDGFKASGGHLGQDDAPHGLLAGGHAGDLPNIGIAADGSGLAEVHAPMVFVELRKKRQPKGHRALLDADGIALIVHAGVDDHWSQPIGNAGGRVACAVLRKPE